LKAEYGDGACAGVDVSRKYTYLGDRFTYWPLKDAICYAVKKNGKCIRSRMGTMLVVMHGVKQVVLARRLRKVVAVLIVCLLLACAKEEQPEYTTLWKVYPIEGRYTGTFYMDNDTIGFHWKFDNSLVISAVNAEEILMENMGIEAKAYVNYSTYQYDPFWMLRKTPCGQNFVAQFFGSGSFGDGWVNENGWFKMSLGGKAIRGNWKSEMVKE
jgi:hypothetical protein